MIPWIRISSYKEIVRSKLTWLLLGLCLVTFLAVLIWPKEAKKESIKTEEAKKESIKTQEARKLENLLLAETPMTQEAGQEGLLPQKSPSEEGEETETDIIETVQGRVTNIDPYCTGMVAVDGIGFDAGSLDLTGVRIGDVVEITYTMQRHGKRKVKVVESIGIISSSQQSTVREVPPGEKPSGELEKPKKPKEPKEPKEPEVYPKTMQGRADYEVCTGMFTVNGINFLSGSVDLTGIQPGDVVEITYTKNKYGLVLESLELVERR